MNLYSLKGIRLKKEVISDRFSQIAIKNKAKKESK